MWIFRAAKLKKRYSLGELFIRHIEGNLSVQFVVGMFIQGLTNVEKFFLKLFVVIENKPQAQFEQAKPETISSILSYYAKFLANIPANKRKIADTCQKCPQASHKVPCFVCDGRDFWLH